MEQIPLAFPSEEDHADRLLRTAIFLMNRARFEAAFEVLQLAAAERLTSGQQRERDDLLERLEGLLDEALSRRSHDHLPDAAGRILPFRRSLRTASRSASQRRRSSSGT